MHVHNDPFGVCVCKRVRGFKCVHVYMCAYVRTCVCVPLLHTLNSCAWKQYCQLGVNHLLPGREQKKELEIAGQNVSVMPKKLKLLTGCV